MENIKSYIENAYQDGIFKLPIQVQPINICEFSDLFKYSKMTAYSFIGPAAYFNKFQTASNFLLHIDNGKIVEFSALVTMKKNCQDEYASLKIEVHNSINSILSEGNSIQNQKFEAAPITTIDLLIDKEIDMHIECGIIFNKSTKFEVKIVAEYGMELVVKAFFSKDQPVIFNRHRQLECVTI